MLPIAFNNKPVNILRLLPLNNSNLHKSYPTITAKPPVRVALLFIKKDI
jgi:hypothetical protein